MNIPSNLKYTKDHEWVSIDGGIATVGITDFLSYFWGLLSTHFADSCENTFCILL